MSNDSYEKLEEYSVDELLAQDPETLEKLDQSRLNNTPAHTIADYLSRLNIDQKRTVLRTLNEEFASEILSEMDAEDSAEIVGAMREWRAVKILENLDPDDAADVVAELEDDDRLRLMGKVDEETANAVSSLLNYDPDTAGGAMNPDVATVKPHMTITQAIEHIRQFREELEDVVYIYVVDKNNKLLGDVKMRDLIFAAPSDKILTITNTELRGVCTPEQDKEIVARTMSELNLHTIPVTDANGTLLGIVSHDDVIDILEEEATEDMQKLVGAGADESIHDGIFYSFQHRVPWLLFNLLTASLAAVVVSLFQDQIHQLTILAVLMPIIAGIGGNTGQQSLAIAIRGLALNEIQSGESGKISRREGFKGLLNGLLVGLVASLAVWIIIAFTQPDNAQRPILALVVFLAMIMNMTLAGISGAFVPLMLKKFNFDPAQSSSIFLTAITDTLGFLILLSLGTYLLI
jgi:magnesium transporter